MTVFFYAHHAAVLLLVIAAAAGAGTLAAGTGEPLALRCALGLALWAEALFLLAAGGWLRTLPMLVLLLLAIAGGVWRSRSWPRIRRVPLLVSIAIGVPAFLLALHPPLAFDETLYHLSFVRDLAETGRLRFLAHLRFPVFPQFQELLCVPGYLLAGDAATHLLSLVEVGLTAWLAASWARRYAERATLLAAALFLGSPIVMHLGTILYVEGAMMLFVTAGFYTLDVALTDSRRAPLVFSAFFFAAACSVKYLGGFFALAALLVVLVRRRNEVLLFAGVIAAAALPTTIWLTLASGNPVFPFAAGLFGRSPWTLPLEPVRGGFWRNALRVPWDATFARELMNAQPPVTPLLIPIVLLVAAAAFRSRRARVLVGCAGVYVVLFTFLPRDSRYLVAFLPLFSVAAAVIATKQLPRVAPLATLAAVAPGVAYLVWRLTILGLPPVTPAERTAELAARIPGYTALMRPGESRVESRVYVCGGEQLQAYAPGQLLGDFAGLHPYARVLDGHGVLSARLRARNVRHFLLIKGRCHAALDPGLALLYEDAGAQLWRVQAGVPR
jgi:hypothetical protein